MLGFEGGDFKPLYAIGTALPTGQAASRLACLFFFIGKRWQ
jgi:hypothetical protein